MTKTCSVKNRESVGPPMIGPPRIKCTSGAPMSGHTARDRRADAEAPVGVLVEAHDLSGKGHAQREQQQPNAHDPGEFAWKLVCAEEEDLRHVDEHDGDHEVRTPAMHGAQIPAKRNVVVERFRLLHASFAEGL